MWGGGGKGCCWWEGDHRKKIQDRFPQKYVPDRMSSPVSLAFQSDALLTALRGPANWIMDFSWFKNRGV